MVMQVMMVMTFVQCFELLTQYLDFMEVLHVHALCISVHKMVQTNFVLKVSKEKLHSMVKEEKLHSQVCRANDTGVTRLNSGAW
jgi:hypothetical protein